jgi:hypothetical protein
LNERINVNIKSVFAIDASLWTPGPVRYVAGLEDICVDLGCAGFIFGKRL